MEKVEFNQHFACRLRDTMIAAGFSSKRSPSGVSIPKLVEITGYSPQICRKYLRGQAIPEPSKLMAIASTLDVSPGWLLFGSRQENTQTADDHLTLNKYLLHYIFKRAEALYHVERLSQDIPDFLLALTCDISQINADEEQSKKIIDLAMSSAKHFSHAQGR